MISVLIYFFIIILINNFISKKNYLKSSTGSVHQLLVNKTVPLSGGIFLLFPFIYYFNHYIWTISAYILLFVLGLLSDLNKLSSTKKRFTIQLAIIFTFVVATKLEVLPTRIDFIDNYFQNSYMSYYFTIFCFLILINGSNFIDGLNGLLLLYILLIFFYLYKLDLVEFLDISHTEYLYFISILIFLLLLNFKNKLFLGDSGSYSVSFFLGFILIHIYNNTQISPYFVIVLLWYPCFENLFSIIRKLILKSNPLNPDNKHLHQYLFLYLKKKFNLSTVTTNNLSSVIINFFNFFVFYIASQNIYSTKMQLNILLICILIYVVSYKVLRNSLKLSLKE